jgi:L-iditol 2-dehydrogenase
VVDATGDPGAVLTASQLTRKGGLVALVGINHSTTPYGFSHLVRRELTIKGVYGAPIAAWRKAFSLWEEGAISPEQLISHSFPLSEAVQAFETAREAASLKVLLIA